MFIRRTAKERTAPISLPRSLNIFRPFARSLPSSSPRPRPTDGEGELTRKRLIPSSPRPTSFLSSRRRMNHGRKRRRGHRQSDVRYFLAVGQRGRSNFGMSLCRFRESVKMQLNSFASSPPCCRPLFSFALLSGHRRLLLLLHEYIKTHSHPPA